MLIEKQVIDLHFGVHDIVYVSILISGQLNSFCQDK